MAPAICPNCGTSKWLASETSNYLANATKHEHDEKYDIDLKDGLFVRSFVCKNCSNVVLIKETYDTELK